VKGRHFAGTGIILILFVCLLSAQSHSQVVQTKAQAPAPIHTPPGHPLPPEDRGDLLMAKQQYVAAIKAYREAPDNSAVVWNKIGIAWQHLYAVDQAKVAYERALRLKPHYPEAMNNLGTVYYEKKNYKKAEKLYRRALKSSPQSATFYNNLGAAYFAQGNFRRGTEAYRHAFAIDPTIFSNSASDGITELGSSAQEANQYYCFAQLFARAGMADRAVDYLRKAFNEGFHNRKRVMQDDAFAKIRNTPAFVELMAEKKRP
jgi:tetratricopeptide (TPR) repeat protein